MSRERVKEPERAESAGRVPWAGLTLVLVCIAIACALHWPLPLHMDWQIMAHFHHSHIWCFDHILASLLGDATLAQTQQIGFPQEVELRFIAWIPALLSLPLRLVFGPLGAYNAVVLLSPALSALAAWFYLRRVSGACRWTCAGASLVFAFSPYVLGSLANGQTAKVQLWIFPLALLALSHAVSGPRRIQALLALPVLTLASAFTSPSLTLFLPFALVLQLAWEWGLRPPRRALGLGFLSLLLVACALLPARGYYGSVRTGHELSAFSPGRPPPVGEILDPSIVSQPEETFLAQYRIDTSPSQSHHVTYMGLWLLGLCTVLCLKSFPGRGLALGAVFLGWILSLGPRLASGGSLVQWGGNDVVLPVQLLESAGYPTAESGMYYRAIAISTLGMALILAGALGRIGRRWAGILAWIIGLGQVAEGVRVTGPLWPRVVQEIPGRVALEAFARDPEPGAVLDLPLDTDPYSGGVTMLASVVHGRACTGLPRQNRVEHLPHLKRLDAQLRNALALSDPEQARSTLAGMGFRYVVWRPSLGHQSFSQETLFDGLGTPEQEGELYYWLLEDSDAL